MRASGRAKESLLIFALVSACEDHCRHQCDELNGDLELECGDCTAAYACWSGAAGFPSASASPLLPIGQDGEGMGNDVEVMTDVTGPSCRDDDAKDGFDPSSAADSPELILSSLAVDRERSPLTGQRFLEQVAEHRPLVLAGFVHQGVIDIREWTDQALERDCRGVQGNVALNPGGSYDWVIVEMCSFLRRYEAEPMYLVQTLAAIPSLLSRVRLPEELRCTRLHRALRPPKLWLSAGSTWSSLHFDGHDAVLAQLDGRKLIRFFHPSDSHNVHMDEHVRVHHPKPVSQRGFPHVRMGRHACAMHASCSVLHTRLLPTGIWRRMLPPCTLPANHPSTFSAGFDRLTCAGSLDLRAHASVCSRSHCSLGMQSTSHRDGGTASSRIREGMRRSLGNSSRTQTLRRINGPPQFWTVSKMQWLEVQWLRHTC